jgi:purine-binding chemotaxis protein CheW
MRDDEDYNQIEDNNQMDDGGLIKELVNQPMDGSSTTVTALELSKEHKKNILRERSRKLAHRHETASDLDESSFPVVEFVLSDEHYAVELSYIREVYPLKDLTPVPCTPSFILGIVNVRGQVVSVTDMRELFNLPKKGSDENLSILIVKNQEMELGIVAESVLGERKIPRQTMHSELPTFTRAYDHYIKGVTSERVIVLNMDAFLSDTSIVVHQEVGD